MYTIIDLFENGQSVINNYNTFDRLVTDLLIVLSMFCRDLNLIDFEMGSNYIKLEMNETFDVLDIIGYIIIGVSSDEQDIIFSKIENNFNYI